MLVETKNVGLAAYMGDRGSKYISKSKGIYTYESDRSLNEWEPEYYNSEFVKHNESVVRLLSIK